MSARTELLSHSITRFHSVTINTSITLFHHAHSPQNECKDWIMTARVLLSELTGEPVPEGLVLPATAQNQPKPPPTPQQLPDTLDVEREKTALSVASLASAEVHDHFFGFTTEFHGVSTLVDLSLLPVTFISFLSHMLVGMMLWIECLNS
jgi:hypothetical protein